MKPRQLPNNWSLENGNLVQKQETRNKAWWVFLAVKPQWLRYKMHTSMISFTDFWIWFLQYLPVRLVVGCPTFDRLHSSMSATTPLRPMISIFLLAMSDLVDDGPAADLERRRRRRNYEVLSLTSPSAFNQIKCRYCITVNSKMRMDPKAHLQQHTVDNYLSHYPWEVCKIKNIWL